MKCARCNETKPRLQCAGGPMVCDDCYPAATEHYREQERLRAEWKRAREDLQRTGNALGRTKTQEVRIRAKSRYDAAYDAERVAWSRIYKPPSQEFIDGIIDD